MAKKIILTVTNDLVTDHRVHRVAETLRIEGYDVVLVGRKFKYSKKVIRPYTTKRFGLWFVKGPLFYASYNIRLFLYLLFHRFDGIIANDLDTLLASSLASRFKRKPCVYDSHEYFTEVPELQGRHFQQNIWLQIEKRLLPKVAAAYTVSTSIANEYQQKYGVPFQVIRNLPLKKTITATSKSQAIMYQGALNLGRGIELMIDSMEFLPDVELWIAGSGDIEEELKNRVQKKHLQGQVKFLGQVPLNGLHDITVHARLGLSLEENMGKNYYFALPNKLFDYIQARIPVLVSDLPEMKQIVQDYQVGGVLQERNPKSLANQIQGILFNETKQTEWNLHLEDAAQVLCWENEKEKLIQIIKEHI